MPPEMEGRSLLPLAKKQPIDWPEEVFVQISESQIGRAIRTHRWKYSVRCRETGADGAPLVAPAADTYTEDCLYDLLADPWELTNLIGAPAYTAVTSELRARLLERMTAIGEKRPTIIAAPTLALTHQRKVEQFPLKPSDL